MAAHQVKIALQIEPVDCLDEEACAVITRQLRVELLQLGADRVDYATGLSVPAGAKGDVGTLGTLLLTLAASGGVLTTMINGVQSWLASKRERGTATLEIDGDKLTVTGISTTDQSRLIDAWINRHDRNE
jgi:hypothetical protein